MKFLFISPRFSGGIGGHAAMLSEQLTKNGHQVKKMETTHIPIKYVAKSINKTKIIKNI